MLTRLSQQSLCICLCALIGLLVCQARIIACDGEVTSIPLIINILKDSGISEDTAKAAVREMNKGLKDICAKGEIVDINTNVTVGNGDAVVTEAEFGEMTQKGKEELDNNEQAKGKGVKFWLGQKYINGAGKEKAGKSEGIGTGNNAMAGTGNFGGAHEIAKYMLHELGHLFGLDHPDGGVMTSPPSGDKFTPGSRGEAATGAARLGQQKKTDGGKVKSQWGSGDHAASSGGGAPFENIIFVELRSRDDQPTVSFDMILAGELPSSGPYAPYRMLFNIDASSSTGITLDGYSGIDRVVTIQPFSPMSSSYLIWNTVSGSTSSLQGSTGSWNYPVCDLVGTDPIEFENSGKTRVDITLTKATLGIPPTGPRFIDVIAIAGAAGSIKDEFALEFDQNNELASPTMTLGSLIVEQGESVTVTGVDFPPSSVVEIRMDDTVLTTDTTSAAGSFTKVVSLPEGTPEAEYFITAITADGDYDFQLIDYVVP